MPADLAKRLVKQVLRSRGWELHRIRNAAAAPQRATMRGGLQWLAEHRFRVNSVLDVGASNGSWTRLCDSYFPDAHYVVFEPQPVHEAGLAQIKSEMGARVQVVKKAVGAESGVSFFDASDPLGGAFSHQATRDTIEVPVTSLDETVRELSVAGPYLIKLDTHGYEPSILKGASSCLAQAEILIIEAYNYRISDEAWLFWELCAYLAQRGFSVIDSLDVMHREFDGSLWQMDLVFVKSSWPGFDHLSYR